MYVCMYAIYIAISDCLAFESLRLLLLEGVDLTLPLLLELLDLVDLTCHHVRDLLQLRLRVAAALPHTYMHNIHRLLHTHIHPDLPGLAPEADTLS